MRSYRDIIDLWPAVDRRTGLQVFAADIDVPYVTAQVMRFRNSIHARHWPAIEKAAARRGIKGVTIKALSEIGAKKSAPKKKTSARRHEMRVA